MATSRLQRQTSEVLSRHFGQYTIRENLRPLWILENTGRRLELDFYIEELKIAVEVNGIQHYQYSPMFHKSHAEYYDQLRRDKLKTEACHNAKVRLFAIRDSSQLHTLIEAIKETIRKPLTYNEYVHLRKQYISKKTKGIRRQIKIKRKEQSGLSRNLKEWKKLGKNINNLKKALDRVGDRAAKDFDECCRYL